MSNYYHVQIYILLQSQSRVNTGQKYLQLQGLHSYWPDTKNRPQQRSLVTEHLSLIDHNHSR